MNKLLKGSFFFTYIWILLMSCLLFCDLQNEEEEAWESIPTTKE